MSGSALIQFLINIIALLAAGAIFFVSIDKVAPDAFFARIAKIAIGALLLIAVIVTVAAVFGLAGGVTVSPLGVVWFAVAVIVAVVVLFVLNMIVDWIATNMGFQTLAATIKYVLGAIVLVALLLAAANFLFGYKVGTAMRSDLPGSYAKGSEPAACRHAATGGDPTTLCSKYSQSV